MNKSQNGFSLPTIAIIIALVIIFGGIYLYVSKESNPAQKLMPVSLYIQDKEVALNSDCRVTKKVTYDVPLVSNIPDESLKLLFDDELSQYGVYDSITIVDGLAKVMLKSDKTPEGRPISGLSSCESGHLLSVLRDTLTQNNLITEVELYTAYGQIEF